MRAADDRIVLVDSAASWTLTELLKYSVIASILTFIGYQFLAGNRDVTAGRLFLYINYVTTLFDLLGMLVRQLPNIQRSQATGRRLLELLDEEQEADAQAELQVTAGVVDFDQVSFAYDGKNQVLKNITIHAKQGETVALVGHTGSGKSSIMNLLYRFYDPQEGRISIDGQDISQFSRESVRSQMGTDAFGTRLVEKHDDVPVLALVERQDRAVFALVLFPEGNHPQRFEIEAFFAPADLPDIRTGRLRDSGFRGIQRRNR